MFENLFDAIEDIEIGGRQGDLVLLPPPNDPYASDEEIGDDDVGLVANLGLPADVTGTLEIHDDTESNSDGEIEAESESDILRWMKGCQTFQGMADENLPLLEDEYPELAIKSMLEIFKLYFDTDIEQLFVECTERYGREHKNDPTFVLTRDQLWDFIVIIIISCYNIRPQFSMYWSIDEDISCSLIRSLMPRNKFTKIKSYFRVCDNNDLDPRDKWAKLRPLINAVNSKLIQLGVFSKHLSADEQMVPYFGRHL